jgi:hypothetical protein
MHPMVLLSPLVAKQLVKRILLDPKAARIATNLLNVSPRSQAAQTGSRVLLGLIKGAQVDLMTPKGRKIPAQIQDDGKIKTKEQPE